MHRGVFLCVLFHIPITYTYSRTHRINVLLLSTLSSRHDSRIVISDAAVER